MSGRGRSARRRWRTGGACGSCAGASSAHRGEVCAASEPADCNARVLGSMGLAELVRNAAAVLPEGELERKLALGRPLRVKLGIDVTAPDVTLGNGIPLQRMAAFQRDGH